jgi:adenylosuccinate lyase
LTLWVKTKETFLDFKVSISNYFYLTITDFTQLSIFAKKNAMDLTSLSAISPIDGRYRNTTSALAAYFSEYALIKYRVFIEIEYFIALCEHPLKQLRSFDKNATEKLRNIYKNFSEQDAASIKDIEKTTNHDVKAVEYFIKNEFDKLGLEEHKEFIHFGLTSQDINNTAIPYSFKLALEEVYLPEITKLVEKLCTDWETIPMLAHTHGQPASPTRLGKEINVFVERLRNQLTLLKAVPYSAKFGGQPVILMPTMWLTRNRLESFW